jgi:hypothetical protein
MSCGLNHRTWLLLSNSSDACWLLQQTRQTIFLKAEVFQLRKQQ